MMNSGIERPTLRILILAPSGRDAPTVADVIAKASMHPHTCATLESLCVEIAEGAGAILLAEEALKEQDAIDRFHRTLGKQSAWSELPVLLIAKANGRGPTRLAAERIGDYRNIVMLERPLRSASLISALQSALTARRRQYEIRDHLLERARQEAELRRLNETLEQRVQARTREVQEALQELQKAMREREEAQRALAQAQKTEAIGQLTGGIAHDFNNLLMVISGGLDMLERSADLERRRKLITAMRQAAGRGEALTRQLLAFARRMTLAPEPVNLRNLIDGMRILVGGALRGDITVEVDLDPQLWPVLADPGQLELALLNLAVNARDAMPSGGVLTLAASNERLDGSRANGAQGEFVRIEVRDTGTGIPPEIIDRIFDPFFTTKTVDKGTGLGLSQVYGFASQSGGHIEVRSRVGQGTTFILHLPRAATALAETQPEQSSAPSDRLAQDGRKVLVVEDNDDVAELAMEMMTTLGFVVERVANAREALAKLAADGRDVDLVFSDVVMPGGMNGVDLARELKRLRPGLPVLLTSGYSDAVRELDPSEGLPLIAKPYRLETLQGALREFAGFA
ncbi:MULTISPECIES: ATP-binding protein [unclassified Bradyrhizobium]|uniref:ATP-binding protein n=1 Tax=unclassified Bradyrhizobium TaxID=2631580 RepID=UPI001BA5CAE3|nr:MULTISPECIES: ATP-binding protein [unclassified Bradyrhizobium]MBR1208781.1 response regulator [Bradyrhizobium sp. AUGA SZCCT0124]MBR1316974.1 response regulator [Bradyrhizobium sp. AUGA SZCCT0051]MBR1345230.1 response regulator [Bradyrhizobium sp. AUGA SZCCT0105]MBR1360068.1 response regulator [Bradyrhizobium sp. AUGA SZCCT0045]